MFRWVLGSIFLLAVAGGAAMGCGSGVTDTEAKSRCQQEQQDKAQCVTSKSYDQCVTCEEQCGDNCQPQAKCPEVYLCSDMPAQ